MRLDRCRRSRAKSFTASPIPNRRASGYPWGSSTDNRAFCLASKKGALRGVAESCRMQLGASLTVRIVKPAAFSLDRDLQEYRC